MSDSFDIFGVDRKTLARKQANRETYDSVLLPVPPWGSTGQLGHFSLLEFIAQGGAGYIYRARDTTSKATCVIKIVPSKYDHLTIRNRLGCRRMMSIDHPNLMKVHRIHILDEYNVVAMEWIKGETLSQWARRIRKSMRPENLDQVFHQVLSLMRDYSAGLAAMHGRNLLHGDIKPENLMVTPDGKGIIIDYDSVQYHSRRSPLQEDMKRIGTVGFVAPEVQIRRRHVPASDIYSLGMVLNACLRFFSRPYSNTDDALESVVSPHSPTLGDSEEQTDAVAESPESQKTQETQAEILVHHEQAIEELEALPSSVPKLLHESCRCMLDVDPDERPTATRLANLGLPVSMTARLLVNDPLYGRDHELCELLEWSKGVARGGASRLNLVGESCLGKTRLITELVLELEDQGWAQVFVGRCRSREDTPLQAFTQICDAIVDRYLAMDRERMEFDDSTTQVLGCLFPALRRVIHWDKAKHNLPMELRREEALSAAVSLCEKLVEIGPLFMIFDDAQWADRDSLFVLDYLRTHTTHLPVGILTVSRTQNDEQRVPPDRRIRLAPLSDDSALELLRDAAKACRIKVASETLREFAVSANGNPFRLKELASEFAVGGILHRLHGRSAADSDPDGIALPHRFWSRRFDRLSTEAKEVMLLVATGGTVSIEQLKTLTMMGDATEASITELSVSRLVQDDATGGECISAYHDRIAEEMVEGFGEERIKEAHSQWAHLLCRANSRRLSARVAGHLLKAEQPRQAVHFAVQAAENAAEIAANAEAGRWFGIAAEHSEDRERMTYLLKAAECYELGEQPNLASHVYNQAVEELPPSEERIRCLSRAVTLSIQCGNMESVMPDLDTLAKHLNLPRPKSVWCSRICSTLSALKLFWSRCRWGDMSQDLKVFQQAYGIGNSAEKDSTDLALSTWNRQRLEACLKLVRPLSIFNNLYSKELNLQAALLAPLYGNDNQRYEVAVGEQVFRSYDGAEESAQSETTLLMLQRGLADSKDDRSEADVYAGLTCVYTLAMRWNHVQEPLEMALESYEKSPMSCQFEKAHTRWMELWSTWHQGRWGQLTLSGRSMLNEANQRGDLFLLRMTCSAFGIGIWLIDDDFDEYDRVTQQIFGTDRPKNSNGRSEVQMIVVLEWISQLCRLLYEGDVQAAWDRYMEVQRPFRSSPFAKIYLFRVTMESFHGLLAIHLYSQTRHPEWRQQVKTSIAQLRAEQRTYPRILADYYEGMLMAADGILGARGARINDCVNQLTQVSKDAAAEKLRPIQLAALDIVDVLLQRLEDQDWHRATPEVPHSGGREPTKLPHDSQRLIQRMRRRNVVAPEKLARLYTVDLSAIG